MPIHLFYYILIILTGIIVLYSLLFMWAFIKKRSLEVDKNTFPSVSIVVAAKDEARYLRVLIDRIFSQNYQEFELVIVNDRSVDDTQVILNAASRQYKNLNVVEINHKPAEFNGKKFAVTEGIKAAKYELILLTDADCIPLDNQWVSHRVASLKEHSEFSLGYSQYFKTRGLLNYFIRYETLLTAIQYLGMALIGKPYMGVGRNLMYRKQIFESNNGFEGIENITGGDDDLFVNKLANKGNTVASLGRKTITFSHPENSWKSFLRQKIRHLSVGKYYRLTDKIILGVFTLSNIVWWIIFVWLIVSGYTFHLLALIFLVRFFFQYFLFAVSVKKIGDNFNIWGIVFLDIIFVFYYITAGSVALITRRVRWI